MRRRAMMQRAWDYVLRPTNGAEVGDIEPLSVEMKAGDVVVIDADLVGSSDNKGLLDVRPTINKYMFCQVPPAIMGVESINLRVKIVAPDDMVLNIGQNYIGGRLPFYGKSVKVKVN